VPEEPGNGLKRVERVGCGIVASVFLVAGFFATFKSGTSSGAAAVLLVLAAVFGYLARTGQTLLRLEAGGFKAEIARRQGVREGQKEVVEVVFDSPEVSDRAKQEVAQTVEGLPAVRAYTRVWMMEAQYEAQVTAAIARTRPDLVFSRLLLDTGLDYSLRGAQSGTVGVVCKYVHGQADSRGFPSNWMERAKAQGAELLITNAGPATIRLEATDGVRIVHWASPADDSMLLEQLDALFGSLA
jgi:hypothetical protein